MTPSTIALLFLAVLAAAPMAPAQSAPAATRGQLLYQTHCIECHTQQMHWRDRKKARSWASLQAEVARWQQTARLGWDDADVVEVTRYLNDTIYRFTPPQGTRRTRMAGT